MHIWDLLWLMACMFFLVSVAYLLTALEAAVKEQRRTRRED